MADRKRAVVQEEIQQMCTSALALMKEVAPESNEFEFCFEILRAYKDMCQSNARDVEDEDEDED